MSKSLLKNYSSEDIKKIIQESQTMSEVLGKLGYNTGNNGPRSTIKNYAIKNGFGNEIDLLIERSKKFNFDFVKELNKKARTDDSEMFCKNSNATRAMLRRRILTDNLIPYKCAICGNEGLYNEKPLVLQLDHINGISNDHRLENLRWLCPNCHSQTETFCSKNHEKRKNLEQQKQIKALEKKAFELRKIEERKKYFDSIDTTKFGWQAQAERDLGISHTQIRRWLNKYYPEKETYKR